MSLPPRFLALACLLAAATTTSLPAGDVMVKTPADLPAALAAANPGDQVILADGTWPDVQLLLDKPGTVSAPLRVRAQNPGKTVLTGSSRLIFAAPYVHVEGLLLKDGALTNGNSVVSFRSDYCRLTDSAVVDYPAQGGNGYYYIYYEGSHNTVDRCLLSGKGNQQPVVGNAIAGARHNTFANSLIKDISPTRENGKEIFRIWGYGGNEEIGDDGAFFTIEGNLFDRADGESSEIISFKSNRNRVINNTIHATLGGITFRSGNYNTVAGNFILGDNRRGCYGMRVTGRYHAVVNNYIADCDYGINVYAGVFIDEPLSGDRAAGVARPGTPLGRVPNYSWVRFVTVAHNTLVNNREYDIHIGGTYDPASGRALLPAGSIFANNLIIKTNNGPAVTGVTQDTRPPFDRFHFVPNTWFANVIHGGTVEFTPARDGFVEKNPGLVPGTDGILRPGPTPAVKAGVKFPGFKVVPHDAPLLRDAPGVGAEEFAAPSTLGRPLTQDDVGPQWVKDRRGAGEKF